ncbi:MAG: hypothetical protein GX282_07790 [Campylobacteraceae bacterium]|nr:hypothetical protein [Campylobacteraceae bacterium]
MKDKLTQALIYESQGLKLDASRIYSEILKSDPLNSAANDGIKRVGEYESSCNEEMLELFFSTDADDIAKFKKWLVKASK